MYESDITKFLRDLKARKPHLESDQQKGRAIWWDHPQDLETRRRYEDSRIPQQPYVYQTQA